MMLQRSVQPCMKSLGGKPTRVVPSRARLSATAPNVVESSKELSAKDVVLNYYKGWNARDIDMAMQSIAEDCVYEDLVFQDAFLGADAFREYLEETISNVDDDIAFVIDDVTDGESGKVGVLWHCEVNGIEFPFSRGCSFYTVNENGKIVFGRDVVEPTIKPGHAAIQVLTLITPIVKKLGPNSNPAILKKLPIASGLVWAFYAAYWAYVMLGTTAPGNPVWQTSPDTIQNVAIDSLNFLYIVPVLSWLGVPFAPSLATHPVDESIFNFVGAWGVMLLPLILKDKEGWKVDGKTKWGLWTGTMFLTNVFLIPYMALRLHPSELEPPKKEPEAPAWGPVLGGVGLFFGVVSVMWGCLARPEFGDIAQRLSYASEQFATDRVFYAFCVDSFLYSIFQAVLMPPKAPAKYRFVPFFGLAAYLLDTNSQSQEK